MDEKNLSDHRLNSPQFNFLVGVFFNPLNWEKIIGKSRARQIRSMSPRIRVWLKKSFRTTKSYIPICAQQPSHVLFKMLMASSAVSQSHVTKPLLGTKTWAIRVFSVTSLFGTVAVSCKVNTNSSWVRMDLSSNIMLSKMRCIYGLSCVIQYSHGMLEVRTLVTILSLLMLPLFWYLNSCRGFHLEIGSHENTSHKQEPLMGRPGEWVLHTNTGIVNLSQSFGTDFSDPILHQINTSSDPKEQVESQLFHVSQVLFQPCVLSQTHPHLEQPPKKKGYIRLKELKKETIRCASLQIGFDVCPLVGR